MRRHMQNISFLTIVGVLLSCAFFFSQQTKASQKQAAPEATSISPKVETLADMPECSETADLEAALDCHSEGADLSERLVDSRVEAVLAQESDSERRMAFMDSQITWQDARDADCTYVRDLTEDPDGAEIAELICHRDHNLERLQQLEAMLCQYYDASGCDAAGAGATP